MATYIVLLRGINVGGRRKILMADLKVLLSKLGFLNITTYIQSGNIILQSQEPRTHQAITNQIEKAILERFKFEVPVMVQTDKEWKQAIENNPFLKDKNISIDRLHLTCLSKTPQKDEIERLNQIHFEAEEFKLIGLHIFICCKDKFSSKSKMTNAFFEKKLECKATNRNWKTVSKLFELTQ